MKKIIIIGATSGIGFETASLFLDNGYSVGVAGRRVELLKPLTGKYPDKCIAKYIDINDTNAENALHELINELDGMDIYLHASGIGYNNPILNTSKEMNTIHTNCEGFTRMVTAAYHYLEAQRGGSIAIISSIAGTKGLGSAPAYSASKRFQNTYINALSQLSHINRSNITFTDIMPGFVDTALLRQGAYPMLMKPEFVAKKIYKAITKRRRRIVIDWRYRIIVLVWRAIPVWIWERLRIKGKRDK